MLEFIHIPKTAGMSICTAIGQQPGHRMAGRVNHLRKVTKHNLNASIGPRAINQDAFIFSCIRNPYDRAVSMYYFLAAKAPHYRANMMAKRETVNTYWQRADKMLPLRFIQPQKAWLQYIERIDKLIRFETLAEDWAEMQLAFDLPALEHKNGDTSRPATPWQDELTQESIAKIGEFYADDFEHFNYERI